MASSFRLRVYFNVFNRKKDNKTYELFHIKNQSESFGSLKRKVLEKLQIDVKLLPFYYFTLQRLYSSEKTLSALQPLDSESVYGVIEREELRWAGSFIVIINDIREDIQRIGKQREWDDYEMIEGSQRLSNAIDLIPESTEFAHENVVSFTTPYSQIDNPTTLELAYGCRKSIHSQYAEEIESCSLKLGRLQKHQCINGKEIFKDYCVCLTARSLWYYPFTGSGPMNAFLYQEVVLDGGTVSVANEMDSSGSTFVVSIPTENSFVPNFTFSERDAEDNEKQKTLHIFKAKSAAESRSWVDAIEQRSVLSCENDIIRMADTFTSIAEEETCTQDVDILLDCTSFEGTLKNGYMRQQFQSYLHNNIEDEFLLFWEYAEDFRKGHPESKDPFDFSSDYIKKGKDKKLADGGASPEGESEKKSAATNQQDQAHVLTWARYLYNKFIVDGAPMQIACPSKDRSRIEYFLSSDAAPADLFYYVQTQIYNQLKFQKFTDFVRLPNFRSVLLSTVMNNINQCKITGQVWCTISPLIPSKLITSPLDFYPSIFPKIDSFELKYALTSDKAVHNKKYSLLAWSPGQHDMSTFEYCSSLKYEVEKDYINNYGKIPLDSDDFECSTSDGKQRVETGGRFASITKSFAAKFGMRNSEPEKTDRVNFNKSTDVQFNVKDKASDGDNNSHTQSIIPTPWRFVGETGASMADAPHYLPFYWWRYVDPTLHQTYDQSYDEQLFEMLPEWVKCIVISRIRHHHPEVDPDTKQSASTTRVPVLHNYTAAVSKLKSSKALDDMSFSSTNLLSSDVILHTASSAIAHGISFTTCGGYDQGKTKPFRICVPHIARLPSFQSQWLPLPIPGRVVCAAYMVCSYQNIGFKELHADSKRSSFSEMDEDVERPSVIDSNSNPNLNSGMLSNASRRLCVLSCSVAGEDKEGEIRLYGSNYSDLYAIIRLSSVIKLAPSARVLNTIEISDESGAIWLLYPDDLTLADNTLNINNSGYKQFLSKMEKNGACLEPNPSACKSWLYRLAWLSSARAYPVFIVHEGYLWKRGKLNTAFRKRWFTMTSELMLRYYSRNEGTGPSKLKGELNLMDVLDVTINSNGKDLVFHTSTRDWELKAESPREALSWKKVIDGI